MALETSGTLSIGGTTTNRSINLELGRSATATSSLGETDLRDLAGVASGAIGIDDFYGASSVYNIEHSVKFEENNTEGMYAQPTAVGNRRTWTVSAWFKRTEITRASTYMPIVHAQVASETGSIYITPTDHIIVDVGYGGTRNRMQTKAVYRDASAWYHIVWRVDTTQGTAANRNRVYINGVLQELDTIDGYPTQNFESFFNNNIPIYVGTYGTLNNYAYCGYMAEVQMTDGVSNAPTEFGEFDEDSGIWKPKAYTGSYGAQGFYLPFDNSSNLGTNAKGNDVNFTLQNITAADQSTDTPTNNFATWNVLDVTRTNTQGVDMVEGATNIKHRSASGWTGTMSTMAVSNGKWYWEGEVRATNGTTMWGAVPVATREASVYSDSYIGAAESNGYDSGAAFYDNDDGYYHDNTFTACTISGSTFNTQTGDVIMIAVDMDNNKLYAGVNGNWCNSSNNTLPNATGITLSDEPHFLATATYVANTTNSYNLGGFTTDTISSAASDANGYGTFEYAPPTGYYALCTKNLAEYG
jgi:hypothetical protein